MRNPRAAARAALDALFPPDPGWLRLLGAIRAVLGALLTFGLVVLLDGWLALSLSDRVLGFALSLFIAATTRDPGRGQQAVTMLLAPVAAIATTTLAALLAGYGWLGACVMVVLVFSAIYGAAFGARWGALGMVGLIGFVMSLVTQATVAHLPAACLVAVLAAADAALVRFVLLPERPATELVGLRRAVRRGVARVFAHIDPALRSGIWLDGARERMMADVQRVSEAAMMAQMRLSATATTDGAAAAVSLRLVELELATERTARIAATDLGDAAERPRVHALLVALRDALRADHMPSAGPATEQFRSRLGRVLTAFAHLLETPLRPVAALPSAAPGAVAAASSGLRPALQGSLAAGLAILGGEALSPNRWYWAAFAAFALFQGTRSRGESIAKAVQFMSGTLAGVLAGVLLATLLAGQTLASLLVLIVAVLLAFDAFAAAYGMMVFWITIALGMLFGMLGYFAPEVLLLRLQETAVGAACGIGVACVVLARPTRDATLAAAEALLPAIGALVSRAAAALLAGAPDPAVLGLVLAAEQRFQDLRAASQPTLHGLVALGHEGQRRRLLFLAVCVFWSRELGDLSLAAARPPDAAVAPTIRDAAARIAATTERLRAGWRSVATDPPEGDGDMLASLPPGLDRGDPAHDAARLLLRIDAALGRLAPRPVSAAPGQRR